MMQHLTGKGSEYHYELFSFILPNFTIRLYYGQATQAKDFFLNKYQFFRYSLKYKALHTHTDLTAIRNTLLRDGEGE